MREGKLCELVMHQHWRKIFILLSWVLNCQYSGVEAIPKTGSPPSIWLMIVNAAKSSSRLKIVVVTQLLHNTFSLMNIRNNTAGTLQVKSLIIIPFAQSIALVLVHLIRFV